MSQVVQPITFESDKGNSKPISFDTDKCGVYLLNAYWRCQHDVDISIILLVNGSHQNDYQNIFGTLNPTLVTVADPSINHNPKAPIKTPFQTVNGALKHFGDRRTGISVDPKVAGETIRIEVGLLDPRVNGMLFFANIHPDKTANFNVVEDARLEIAKEDGTVLLNGNLSRDFDAYNIVQMGGLFKDANSGEWLFDATSNGFSGNFNKIVEVTLNPTG